MYAYIKGSLEEKLNDYIVVEASGVGYKIYMSSTSIEKVGELGNIVKIYTHHHVREDNISLYGFLSNEELKMFELLLSVSGIGAKSAIAILSQITPSSFTFAVISNDVDKLKKIPGIGAKTAARIILELKDKLKTEQAIEPNDKTEVTTDTQEDTQEVIAGLQMLGYNRKEIEKAIEKIDTKGLSIEDIIRKALNILSR